ncbi:phenylacetic acid degradation operon negative regulatory protein PaaX [Heyndrickxia sporothermodurans]|uniref:Phenylacetic acid degradation operon negative regulatory protein PaaX n=3 Tax=Heyndrickxia sporothermodurans TaxID=46224 RepID=A0AB37HDF5_9BACI|nr:phenylacetic acid degradation operon negative regulatory protein PaaX [Heyndrickxia sporothermodurans]MBL5767140.1 phenylacetic acid degradation operon negative regulatory protein PaaX [Heyndrickxia sporothermodurans]MBL5770639.1 phenylacetic acid degradation operon negative regulatory protein PaaX [Heyndrickxia sporothermodurans]MBL5775503.1 phenylacetic acid degradation operon negative regulatory protein PaaX [Heyndrickxia sporothermodurans]MBL5778484.1 phenylacetic acid degradation operon
MNTRSMIFTIYGDYIRHYGSEIWIGSLIKLLKEFGHNEQAVRAAISRMNKQGWVEARKESNRSYYYLTPRGIDRMEEAATRIFKLKQEKWDGKWTMLTYSIPEEKRAIRDELRKELVWSGFGSIANSCWISPNRLMKQVKTLVEKYEISNYVHIFLTEYQGPHENIRLVQDCWDIPAINSKYKKFIDIYQKKYDLAKTGIQTGNMTPADCFVERTKLVHEYRKFLFIDPGLPEELLPEIWFGNQAAQLFSDYYKELVVPAGEFFESVFSEGNHLYKKNKKYDIFQHPLLNEE